MMGSSHQVVIRVSLLLCWFCISSALDLNIMNYDNKGGAPAERLTSDEVEMRWVYEDWMVRYDKSHVDAEKERRFEIFKDNLRFVDEHNRPGNNHSYTVGLNELADLTNEEYRDKYLNKLIGMRSANATSSVDVGDHEHVDREQLGQVIPASVDWRSSGAIGPVVNQGECGSCWAWTAAAAVEALHHIRTGDRISLSAQQLVDCAGGLRACVGGYIEDALDYIVNNRGIDTLESYPYKKVVGTCKRNAPKVVTIDSRRTIFSKDEVALKKVVAQQPVGIAIEAVGRSFQLYKGGIFTGPCGTRIDHAMIAIGYGTENGQDYWLIKNTYGVYWGEDGFVRLERNIASRSGRRIHMMLQQYDYYKIEVARVQIIHLRSQVEYYSFSFKLYVRWMTGHIWCTVTPTNEFNYVNML